VRSQWERFVMTTEMGCMEGDYISLEMHQLVSSSFLFSSSSFRRRVIYKSI
jgi:hypothetical protein